MTVAKWLCCICIVGLLAACNDAPAATPTPTETAIGVEIASPSIGMIVYDNPLVVSGFADVVSAAGFKLQVFTALDDMLLDTEIQPENGTWSVEIPHNYEGDPVELSIIAFPADGTPNDDYDFVSVVIAPQDFRPEGTYAEIYSPAAGDRAGGEIIPVQGVASGMDELRLTLENQETVLAQQFITVDGAGSLNEIPWLIELPTTGYTGRASVRLYEGQIMLDSIDLLIDDVAG